MPKIARIFLLLLCAWFFLNIEPAVLCALPKKGSFSEAALALFSGQVWYWELANFSWNPPGPHTIFLLARGAILAFALSMWLCRPTILRASILLAIGPLIAPIGLGAAAAIFTFPLTLIGGLFVRMWRTDSKRPAPDPSAPMATYHH